MSDLDNLRKDIDLIDSNIVKLLEERFDLCNKIGTYKLENNIPILNENRENEVLNINLNKAENYIFKEHIKNVLVAIMSNSREIQKNIILSSKEELK